MDGFAQDVRYALRHLRHAPGFTATALLTLAIGIGANTAVFTLVHGVLLRSLPIADPAHLYKLGDEYRCCVTEVLQGIWSMFSYQFYEEARDHTDGLDQLAAAQTTRPDLTVRRLDTTDPAAPFRGEFVSGNYFSTLGVRALAGRMLSPADDHFGAAPVAVASFRALQKSGFDLSLVGRPVAIDGIPVTIVGVAPPAFFGDRLEANPPDLWMPLTLEPRFDGANSPFEIRSAGWLYLIGRLRPGAEPQAVQAQLTTELRRYLLTPGNANPRQDLKKVDEQQVPLTPAGGGINAMKGEYEQGLLLLMAASIAVLLIACGNLANLLLARGASHAARTALQFAIGASRWRILRSNLTESLVLSLLGGAAGLMLATWATRALLLVGFRGAEYVPVPASPSIPILLFTFSASMLTGIVFGAGPAWMAARADPAQALRAAGRTTDLTSASWQRSLVVGQAALSVVLLTVAGLLAQSLRNLDRADYGFERQGRLIARIDPQSAGYAPARLDALYKNLEETLARVPSVASASLSLFTAQQGNNLWSGEVFFPGRQGRFVAVWNRVSAHYFETIGTPVVRGRAIGEQDTADARRVAVVNETFARIFFPGEDPVGRHFGKNEPSHTADFEIVGVVKDARYADATRAPRPMFFVPLDQTVTYEVELDNRIEESSRYVGSIELQVRGDPELAAPQVRRALAGIDPNLTPISMLSFDDQVRIHTSEQTLISGLSSAFGLIALLLASIGIYGITAYSVVRRTNEVGVRIALGATPADIVSLVVRGALSRVGAGLLLGVPLALLSTYALRHQLYGVSTFDPLPLVAAVGLLGACALLAAGLPARRAAAIDPIRSLRAE